MSTAGPSDGDVAQPQGVAFRLGLRARARQLDAKLVFPEGEDPRTCQAVAEMLREGLLVPVLLGPPMAVRARLAEAGVDPDRVAIFDPKGPATLDNYASELHTLRQHKQMTLEEARGWAADPLIRGALMVRRGEVDGSIAGAVYPTARVLRAALWCVGLAPGISVVSSSFYMVVKEFRGGGDEVLTFTDAGVVPDPTAEQLADIAAAAARARRGVVGDEPRVAFLSYSTRGSAAGPNVERVRRAAELFRLRHPEVPSDGELQADAALIEAVGAGKAPGSPVAGQANVLVFPDLGAANIAYKLVQRLAGAAAVGPVVQGLAHPCNDLSRGALSSDVVEMACVTALMTRA